MSARSDHDLVAGVRAGDDGSFATLYRRHHAHVTALVRSMVRDPGRGEDIVQDAFVSALRRMRQTDADIAFKPWISEIARNASIDHFRRSGRARELPLDAEHPLPPADARRMGAAPGPEHALLGRQRFIHLRGALDELNPTHRRMIVLRELEGHSYRDIGRMMDLTPSGVESTLFRARRRLETEYDELHTGARCLSVQSSIRSMVAGTASRRERGRVHRHVRRCSLCARHARMSGVDTQKRGLARVAALLPIPALAGRPRLGVMDWVRSTVTGGAASGQAVAPMAPVAFDHAGPIAQAVTVMAAALAIGHGPASQDDAGRPGARAALPAPVAATVTATPTRPSAPSRGPVVPVPPAVPRAAPSSATAPRDAARGVRPRPTRPPASPAPPAAATERQAPATTSAAPAGAAAPQAAGAPSAAPAPRPVRRTATGAAETVKGLVPDAVTLPGSTTPVVAPRQVVQELDETVKGLTGTVRSTITGR